MKNKDKEEKKNQLDERISSHPHHFVYAESKHKPSQLNPNANHISNLSIHLTKYHHGNLRQTQSKKKVFK